MGDFLVNFLQFNESVNFSVVISLVIAYIALFWIIVSVWVYFDAKKRFKEKRIIILISVANFVFQLPFLLLYLLFRPIEDEDFENIAQGGVNVPLVNFIGSEGVAMSLELRINQHNIKPENASEMKIDVSFDSQDQNKVLVPTATAESLNAAGKVKMEGFIARIKQKFGNKPAVIVQETVVKEEKESKKKKDKKK